MTILTEANRTAEFLQSEANGYRSREVVVVDADDTAMVAGAVLGQITAAAATAAAQAGNTGNATSSAVTTGVNVQAGVYNVEFITATEFLVIDPDGNTLGNGVAGTEFDAGDELVFTLTAGDTPMVAGDGFTITVAAGSGKYVAYDAAATNGAAVVAGLLYEGVLATHDGNATIIKRDAEVKHYKLTYTGTKAVVVGGLAALGIISRD